MQQHAADDGEDHTEIELANPAHGLAADISGERRVDMNLGFDEFLIHARMTLSAGPGEVRRIDGRPRIARRKNVVHAMAAGAIGDDLRPQTRCQSVIAGKISGGTPAFNAEFLRKPDSFVATSTG